MKNETLEEAAERYSEDFDLSFYDTIEEIPVKQMGKKDFIEGAKWQEKRMYSEDDMIKFGYLISDHYRTKILPKKSIPELFEQFKKK
jgi:hypothetical protein